MRAHERSIATFDTSTSVAVVGALALLKILLSSTMVSSVQQHCDETDHATTRSRSANEDKGTQAQHHEEGRGMARTAKHEGQY